jgi:c-di-GMP-binding flagellar brake protein YcgR
LLINPGSRVKVEVFLRDPPFVFYSVVKTCDETALRINAPKLNGKRVTVPTNTKVTITESGPDGLVHLDSLVSDIDPEPPVLWVIPIPQLESIHKIQRRTEPRYEIDLHFPWRNVGASEMGGVMLCHVININSHGALVSLGQTFEIDDEIVLDLTPLIQVSGETFEHKVTVKAKVVREAGKGTNTYGLLFENLGRREKSALLSAVRRLKSRSA